MKLINKQYEFINNFIVHEQLYTKQDYEKLVDVVLSAINGEIGKQNWDLIQYRIDSDWHGIEGNWDEQQLLIETVFGNNYDWNKIWKTFDDNFDNEEWEDQKKMIEHYMEIYKINKEN